MYIEIKNFFTLNSDQYIVIESIRYLSTHDPEHRWCTQKKDSIAEFCGISRATVFRAISRGKEKKIIESHPAHEDWIRTTQFWNDQVLGLADMKRQSHIETQSLNVRRPLLQTPSQCETDRLNVRRQNTQTQSHIETHNNIYNTVVVVEQHQQFLREQEITDVFLTRICHEQQIQDIHELNKALTWASRHVHNLKNVKGWLRSDAFFQGKSTVELDADRPATPQTAPPPSISSIDPHSVTGHFLATPSTVKILYTNFQGTFDEFLDMQQFSKHTHIRTRMKDLINDLN